MTTATKIVLAVVVAAALAAALVIFTETKKTDGAGVIQTRSFASLI